MLFHTLEFAAFMLVVFLVSRGLRHRPRLRNTFLLASSYYFYMAWNVKYLVLILFSTGLDYVIGAAIHRSDNQLTRRLLLTLSLAGNLGVLALFKYYGFFLSNLTAVLASLGLPAPLPALELLLPVGISFYTFQTLSYTIDIYRGRLVPRGNLVDFALFVAFFPQLVAGPIVRAREFLPQLDCHQPANDQQQSSGLYLILKGLVKKVIFADVLATFIVDPVFRQPQAFAALWVVVAVYAFKFQIYGDFSGYSDIAIGAGRLLGFQLPVNFRSPYKASSIGDYWQRWHITMGSWFRDYLFFPLGGSRSGLRRTCGNLVFTMALVGLWHGASWTFVIWGAYYGLLLAGEQLFRRHRRDDPDSSQSSPVAQLTRIFVTFQLTAVGSLLFRSTDPANLGAMVRAMGQWHGAESLALSPPVVMVGVLAVVSHFLPERIKEGCERLFCTLPPVLQGAVVLVVMVALRFASTQTRPFYYFQF